MRFEIEKLTYCSWGNEIKYHQPNICSRDRIRFNLKAFMSYGLKSQPPRISCNISSFRWNVHQTTPHSKYPKWLLSCRLGCRPNAFTSIWNVWQAWQWHQTQSSTLKISICPCISIHPVSLNRFTSNLTSLTFLTLVPNFIWLSINLFRNFDCLLTWQIPI